MSTEIDVLFPSAAPPEPLFRALTDTDGFHKWLPGFVQCDRRGDITSPGTRFAVTRRLNDTTAEAQYEVLQYSQPSTFSVRMDGPPPNATTYRYTYTLSKSDTGTDVRVTVLAENPEGVSALALSLILKMLRSGVQRDLHALGAYVSGVNATAD